MTEKKIIKQKDGFMYFDDKTKISIAEYRSKLGLKPLKKDIKKSNVLNFANQVKK